MKKTLAITLALLSAHSVAADNFISKSAVPTRIVVAKAGIGLAQFSMTFQPQIVLLRKS
jgi:hypothetical protein